MLSVGGRSMLARVLDAVAGADPRIVVGPDDLTLPDGVLRTRERPAGGGPVAALAAGLALVPWSAGPIGTAHAGQVAIVGADLPFLTVGDVRVLRSAVGDHDGAAFVDEHGRVQWLCGVWRPVPIAGRLDELGDPAGVALRTLFSGLRVATVGAGETTGPVPWYDCDTEEDLVRAQRWAADARGTQTKQPSEREMP
jgi:molybdopterin-guanine dinucleotide biosynthesis protein A